MAFLSRLPNLTLKSSTAPLQFRIPQRTISSLAVPPDTVNMTTTATKYTYSAPNSKHDTAKKWLQRQLRKASSRGNLKSGGDDGALGPQFALKRPQTAPSTGTAAASNEIPPVPAKPIIIERPSPCRSTGPVTCPMQTDPGIVRDVNAWLDASMHTTSPPLMGGLSYWRAATTPGAKDSDEFQHAIPIVRKPESSQSYVRQSSSRSHPKKFQVQMLSILHSKSQRSTNQKQDDRESMSMPLLAIPYEAMRPGDSPSISDRPVSFLRPATRPRTANASTQSNETSSGQTSFGHGFFCYEGPTDARRDNAASIAERRMNTSSRPTVRSIESTRPSTAAAGLAREDSMGGLSDAPTYFTGLPPPSYTSRTASILTVSSFGCIDGMNTERRQISQQRAARQQGVRGRLRRLAENFNR